ncbi:MAG: alpha/beta hydrolase-fold protein [Planctomycetota bacterium]
MNATAVVQELVESARTGDLERVFAAKRFPIVGDGWALFVYRGEADQVLLHHWIFGLASAMPFQRIVGTDVWTLELELQHAARVEYKLEIVAGGQQRLVQDPLNDQLARDPFGANSVVTGPGYVDPEWAEEHPSARKGEVVERRLKSDIFGDVRPLSIYKPARFSETRRYPLIVVHDGLDYQGFAAFTTVLDNLIHRLEIPPLIAALTQSPNRLDEYAASDQHARFLVDEIVPLLEAEFPLLEDPRDRALLGASFGAVASLHAAWSRPGTFGKLFLQSGSFAFTDIGGHERGPLFDPVVEFVNRFRANPGVPAQEIFLSCGVYESLIYYNRSLLPVLQGTGADVRLVESQDGHNWENWRDRLRDGLTWLFPGPLWMIYE